MERLTSWNEDCVLINGHALGYATKCELVQMAERLAAYEDTELTPEEIACISKCANEDKAFAKCPDCLDDRLRELAEADKDGRVLILEKENTDGTTYKPE